MGYYGEKRDYENRYITMGARIYDPDLGQFLSVDLLADIFAFTSPYVYANHTNKVEYSNLPIIGKKDSNKKSWLGRQISGLFSYIKKSLIYKEKCISLV